MADEELIDQGDMTREGELGKHDTREYEIATKEKQDKKAQCKKGKLVEKENCQVGNVSRH